MMGVITAYCLIFDCIRIKEDTQVQHEQSLLNHRQSGGYIYQSVHRDRMKGQTSPNQNSNKNFHKL